jgi:hypothetical protein
LSQSVFDEARLVTRAGATSPVTGEDVVNGVLAPITCRIIFLPSTLTDDYAQLLTGKHFDRV